MADMRDQSKRDLSNESKRIHRHVGTVIKRVETLVQEVEELRQQQEALTARVGVEVIAGKYALGRVTATTRHVDPVVVSAAEGTIKRLRGEVLRLEHRAEIGMATMQAVLRDTIPGRTLLEQEQNVINQSEFYAVKERLRMCEDQVAVLIAVKQQALDASKVEKFNASKLLTRPSTNVSEKDLMQLEAGLQTRLMSLIQKVSSGMAWTVEQLAAKLNELQKSIELEGVARVKVEESITGVIEKAVCGVAKATNHEIVCCMNKMRQLDVKLSAFDASILGKVEKRCLRLEENLATVITDCKKSIGILGGEMTQTTHSILDELVRGRDARVLAIERSLSKTNQQFKSFSEIQGTASRMAHEVQHIAIIRLLVKHLNTQNQQHEETLSNTITSLRNKIDRELVKINSKCTESFEEAEKRARCITYELRSKQDEIEVRLVLADLVMHLVETESGENLDTFMTGCIAKDAVHMQSGKRQFQTMEAVLVAKAADMRNADRAEASLWFKQQKNANKMILNQVKGNRRNFQQTTVDLEDKYTTIYRATVELAARIESNNVSQCLVETIVERERQAQATKMTLAISAFSLKLKTLEVNLDSKLINRVSIVEEVVSKVASDWEIAVQAAVTAFRPSGRHRTPEFVRCVFP